MLRTQGVQLGLSHPVVTKWEAAATVIDPLGDVWVILPGKCLKLLKCWLKVRKI